MNRRITLSTIFIFLFCSVLIGLPSFAQDDVATALYEEGIRKYNFSLIVEGQFDVVMSHQAGYNNAVAVSGTALTAHHVGLLQRLSNRVVLALDADRAGVAAVKRAADIMLARGIDLKVAELPEGSDPRSGVRARLVQQGGG